MEEKKGLKILLMDDDSVISELLRNVLSSIGHQVELVSCGEEALEKYRQSIEQKIFFDLVILDLNIHDGMGGVETFVELKKTNPEVVAVLITGVNVDTEKIPEGFAMTLQKPFRLGILKNALKELERR